jgi:hypothetical protein|tara:strand:+ start:246 stop:521 length:276 start_codon:yes stop_codon:yes gene_type:complete
MLQKFIIGLLPADIKRVIEIAKSFDMEELEGFFDLGKRMFSRLDTREERMFVIRSWIDKQRSDGYMSGPELLQWGRDAGLTTKRKGKSSKA